MIVGDVLFWWDVHRLHAGNMSCLRMCFFFGSSLCIFHI